MKIALDKVIEVISKAVKDKFTGRLVITFHFNSGHIPVIDIEDFKSIKLSRSD